MNETYWKPFDPFIKTPTRNFAFILLNQPIGDQLNEYFTCLWSKACVRLCADGAANRLFNWAKSRNDGPFIPDYIIGDLDSIEHEARSLYEKNGCKILRIETQNVTDFDKVLKFTIECLHELNFENFSITFDIRKKIQFDSIYCFCGFGGRTDHALALFNSLYINKAKDFQVLIVSDENFTFLLKPGKNLIYFKNDHYCGKFCGFFPIGEPSIVTTKGLKWDVNCQLCKLGTLVSSSNEYETENDTIEILTENTLIWTMSIKI